MRTSRDTNARWGWPQQKERKRWVPLVNAGQVSCTRCGRPIEPGTPWDLGHDDYDHSRWTGPEHSHCNRSAGARLGAARRGRRRRDSVWSREWL